MSKVVVHYSEIALKGKNSRFFIKVLIQNIKESALFNQVAIIKTQLKSKRLIIDFSGEKRRIITTLKNVFGIRNFLFTEEVEKTESAILTQGEKFLKQIKAQGGVKIAFKTKRADKIFPLTSVEVNTRLGAVAQTVGLKVDYKQTQHEVFTEITNEGVFMGVEKIQAYGGLPVGSSGKCLCLLSGGLDSPVAAWQMMKRGIRVDFLHVHSFRTNQEASQSKIAELVKSLNRFQFRAKLWLVPYSDYSLAILGQVPNRYNLVLFKRFLLKLGEKLIWRRGYKALFNGDNLGQVASQTLSNLRAAQFGFEPILFRPLLTSEKEDIVRLAKEIGTHDLSIQKYKDCCSLVSKNPQTQTKVQELAKVCEEINFEEIVEEVSRKVEVFEIN